MLNVLAPARGATGRTALAVERLQEVGARMESAMGVSVNQAGVVSELV